jgi:hypothetical protein
MFARFTFVSLAALVVAMVLGLGLWSGGFFGDRTVQAAPERERHPHIRVALEELREARRELKEADHDFGGHRKAALVAVDEAIVQLEKALKFDKK